MREWNESNRDTLILSSLDNERTSRDLASSRYGMEWVRVRARNNRVRVGVRVRARNRVSE